MHACICVWKPFRTCVYTYTDVYAHMIAPDVSLHMGSLSCKQKIICAYTWISMYVTCIYVCVCTYVYNNNYKRRNLIQMDKCAYTWMCIHIDTCIHTCIHTYIQ